MKKTQKGSRWHPPRVSGMQKQMRVREWERLKAQEEQSRPSQPIFSQVSEAFKQKQS